MRFLVIASLAGFLTTGCLPHASQVPSRVAAAGGGARGVHHFVYFGRDRERISDAGFLSTAGFEGAQLVYAWKELEPSAGVYDFSAIRQDVDTLKAKGKKLFIQLQDATFNPKVTAVPTYLTKDPKYHGGVVFAYDANGNPDGVVAMRWDPAVRAQFHKLLGALGAAFDGEIAGLNLQETAIDVTAEGPQAAVGFTYTGYRDAIIDNLSALRRSFPKSVGMQYVNFMPGEWLPGDDHGYMSSVFAHAQKIGAAIGAPDLMPKRPAQQSHAYKFMHEMVGTLTVGVAVQDGNYAGTTGDDTKPTPPWPNLVPELADYATSYLGVTYLFWGAQEPYFSHDVVPYFAAGHP